MAPDILYAIALFASAVWFSMAFRVFSFKQGWSASIMLAKPHHGTPVFDMVAAAIRFLGGMNGALAFMAWALLTVFASRADLFREADERGFLLIVFAAAHFSQFIFNVPILRNGERQGDA